MGNSVKYVCFSDTVKQNDELYRMLQPIKHSFLVENNNKNKNDFSDFVFQNVSNQNLYDLITTYLSTKKSNNFTRVFGSGNADVDTLNDQVSKLRTMINIFMPDKYGSEYSLVFNNYLDKLLELFNVDGEVNKKYWIFFYVENKQSIKTFFGFAVQKLDPTHYKIEHIGFMSN